MNSFFIPALIAIQFLTIIPVYFKKIPTAQQNALSLLFYPFVGLMIGGMLWSIATLLSHSPIILTASLITTTWVIITGGLHLDGLADTADAWVGGYGDRDRTLKIMKDPQSGPIGVLSLVLLVLLKFSAIYTLLDQHQYLVLLVVPMIGRLTALFLLLSCLYVRPQGLGSLFLTGMPRIRLIFVMSLCMLFLIGIFLWQALIVIAVVLLLWLGLRRLFQTRLGGVTGDTIGASIEISECVAIFVMALLIV